MAYTNMTPTRPTHTGIAMTAIAGDDSNGNKISNDGKVVLLLSNTGGSSATVTFATPGTVRGLAIADNVVTLASGQVKACGPFPPEIYNQPAGDTDAGCLRFTYGGSGAGDVDVFPIQN